jgi:predicted nucleic acid-binding protein
MRSALLDTGFLVALLDRSERSHEACLEIFEDLQGELLSTEPVLTEAVYLLGPSVRAQRACIEFFVNGGAALVPQSADSLSRACTLMEKYEDVPMDFADATLVVLAEETGVNEVLTLDRRGFGVYRIRGRKAFRMRPEPR